MSELLKKIDEFINNVTPELILFDSKKYGCVIENVTEEKLSEEELTEPIDEKVIKTLEWFLSLHEADEIYSMIYDEKQTIEDIENKLMGYYGKGNN